jgi:adenylate cyclase class 1
MTAPNPPSAHPGGDATGLLSRLDEATRRAPREREREEAARLAEALAALPGPGGQAARQDAALLLAAPRADAGAAELCAALLPHLGPEAAFALTAVLLRAAEADPRRRPDLAEAAGPLLPHVLALLLGEDHPQTEPLRGAALAALPRLAALEAEQAGAFLDAAEALGLEVPWCVGEALRAGAWGTLVRNSLAEAAEAIAQGRRPARELAGIITRHAVLEHAPFALDLLPILDTRHAPTLLAALPAVLRCRPGTDAQLAVAAARAALHPDRRVKGWALAVLAVCAPKGQGKILAGLAAKDPAADAAAPALLPLLPRAEYLGWAKARGGARRAAPATFAALAALAPRSVRALLAALSRGAHAAGAALLEARLPAPDAPDTIGAPQDARAAAAAWRPQAPAADAEPGPDRPGRNRTSLLARLGAADRSLSVQFDGAGANGLRGAKGSPVHQRRTLRGADFSAAFLDGAIFEDCVLEGATFSGALLRGARFTRCTLTGCDLSGCRMYDCILDEVRLEHCDLRGALLYGGTVAVADFRLCNLRAATLCDTDLATTRFTACSLSALTVRGGALAGVELVLSCAAGATLGPARLTGATLAGATLAGTRVAGATTAATDHPALLRLEDGRLPALAAALAARGPAPAPEPAPGEAEAAAALVDLWFQTRAQRAALAAFLRNNLRRESWCRHKLGPQRSRFYRLAPLLLHADALAAPDAPPEDGGTTAPDAPQAAPAAAFRLANYAPDYTTLADARELFPGLTPPDPAPQNAPAPVSIEGLYTIGSTGTAAQTPTSDLDYWVCHDHRDMTPALAGALAARLERIEGWAARTFGLEVHFFAMDLERVRGNNFGFSDKESSGSAQAVLLKEEFYRTAVRVAGKAPLWWITPPGADDRAYEAARRLAARGPLAAGLADLGNLAEIPPGEFFGASLWQIVKALTSPFKSIMKFGLLERYMAAGASGPGALLCDRVKAGLLAGRTALAEVDPYVLLLREVSGHYARAGEKDSLTLVRLSFLLKGKIADACAPDVAPLRGEDAELRAMFQDEQARLGTGGAWSFRRLEHVGGLVNAFIVRTYTRVRELRPRGDDVSITPEDLTKLGRRISASFSRRRHKVEHVPFLSIGGNTFRILHFLARQRTAGRPGGWEVQGAQEVAGRDRLQLADLRKGDDLAAILVWLAANRLFAPGMEVRADYSISPVTARDLNDLLQRLTAFFPPEATFNTEVDEMLRPERIVRAFFILNLVQPREQAALREATLVYSTNWGELFCRTVPVRQPGALLADPGRFLLEHADQGGAPPQIVGSFVPDRASCPRMDG